MAMFFTTATVAAVSPSPTPSPTATVKAGPCEHVTITISEGAINWSVLLSGNPGVMLGNPFDHVGDNVIKLAVGAHTFQFFDEDGNPVGNNNSITVVSCSTPSPSITAKPTVKPTTSPTQKPSATPKPTMTPPPTSEESTPSGTNSGNIIAMFFGLLAALVMFFTLVQRRPLAGNTRK
jgi:hypothetical protein